VKFAFGTAMLALEKINNRWELDGIKYVTMKYLTVVYQIDTNYASVQRGNCFVYLTKGIAKRPH